MAFVAAIIDANNTITNLIVLPDGASPSAFGAEVLTDPDVGIGWIRQPDNSWLAPAGPAQIPPTDEDVNAERDRRIRAGKSFTPSGYGTAIRTLGTETDMRNLQNLAQVAQVRIAAGLSSDITPFRDADDVVHQLTQPQMLDLWLQGFAYVSAIYQASWMIKDNPSGIALDFKQDSYWP